MSNIISILNERIAAELTPVDREQVYRDMLDECNPEVTVGGLTFSPSRVIEELDPVAFRCGVDDYFGTDDTFVEVGDETYRRDEVEQIQADFAAELQAEGREDEVEEVENHSF